jgi:hypothetical protein
MWIWMDCPVQFVSFYTQQQGCPDSELMVPKLTSKIIDEIVESFDRVGGEAYLDELALRDPPTYCRLIMRVLPSAVTVETSNEIDLGELMIEADARLAKMKREP